MENSQASLVLMREGRQIREHGQRFFGKVGGEKNVFDSPQLLESLGQMRADSEHRTSQRPNQRLSHGTEHSMFESCSAVSAGYCQTDVVFLHSPRQLFGGCAPPPPPPPPAPPHPPRTQTLPPPS